MTWSIHRGVIVAFLVVAASACDSNKNATPKDAKVLEWTLAKTTRASMKDATLTNKATKDLVINDAATGVKLSLKLETATAKFNEGGKDVEHDAIVGLTATATNPNEFTLVDRGCDGPNHQLAAPGAAPRAMILDCRIKADKPKFDGFVSFQLLGDGTLLP